MTMSWEKMLDPKAWMKLWGMGPQQATNPLLDFNPWMKLWGMGPQQAANPLVDLNPLMKLWGTAPQPKTNPLLDLNPWMKLWETALKAMPFAGSAPTPPPSVAVNPMLDPEAWKSLGLDPEAWKKLGLGPNGWKQLGLGPEQWQQLATDPEAWKKVFPVLELWKRLVPALEVWKQVFPALEIFKKLTADPKAWKQLMPEPDAMKSLGLNPKAWRKLMTDPSAWQKLFPDPTALQKLGLDPEVWRKLMGDPKTWQKLSTDRKAWAQIFPALEAWSQMATDPKAWQQLLPDRQVMEDLGMNPQAWRSLMADPGLWEKLGLDPNAWLFQYPIQASWPNPLADTETWTKFFTDPVGWIRIWETAVHNWTELGLRSVVQAQPHANPSSLLQNMSGWLPSQAARLMPQMTVGPLEWSSLLPRLATETPQRMLGQAWDYWVDHFQRWILYMDTMRQRGNIMLAHYEAGMPALLDFEHEKVLDAREFDRPANYQLLQIKHPEGKKPAPGRRPMVVIDPRAGHGPGIGGFKRDSEVGMGLTEGHPVYFVTFTPEPCPGQTIEDVELAEARFLEEVRRRHPDRDEPIVYGNCQAGWAVAMLGADRPEITGPIVINGAPMSYWAGRAGVNPMRLAGGLSGGAWATRMLCDLGYGKFDGAYLVANFENLNPANTLWKKDYNLFSRIDKEQQRFLDFEKWWTGFYFLNEEEILWIVNNLFIGDKLEHGKLRLGPNHSVDMRNLKDPLVIFASSGDNITPPQQALHWLSELYPTTEALKKAGQRVVYMINPHVGHLGIFVSAKVAKNEHRAIIEHIERIRALKPGIYQMVIEGETGEKDPLKDQFIVSFKERRVEDVRFPYDEKNFEKMLAVSRANEELYLTFGRPLVRMFTTPLTAEFLKWTHPARMSRYIYSDRVSPAMALFAQAAEQVRRDRKPVDRSNIYLYAEERLSDIMASLLDAYRDMRDNSYEVLFDLIYS